MAIRRAACSKKAHSPGKGAHSQVWSEHSKQVGPSCGAGLNRGNSRRTVQGLHAANTQIRTAHSELAGVEPPRVAAQANPKKTLAFYNSRASSTEELQLTIRHMGHVLPAVLPMGLPACCAHGCACSGWGCWRGTYTGAQ